MARSSFNSTRKRGAFIVLEGLDRSGKTTQAERLVANLTKQGISAKNIRFPDRSTAIGTQINDYLNKKIEVEDRAIHLLFSANRWEKEEAIRKDLEDGVTLICDRYSFSGIAYTANKGIDYDWCKACDVGLPEPDLTLFLSLSQETAAQRGGFGEERYETEKIQRRVRELFTRIGQEVGAKWKVIDAGKSMDEVEKDILESVNEVSSKTDLPPVGKLWT